MLSKEQYELAIQVVNQANVQAAKAIIADGSIPSKEAVHYALDALSGDGLSNMAWDLTRYNVHMVHLVDITDRLRADNPHLVGEIECSIRTLEWFYVYSLEADTDRKESMIASSGGKSFKDERGDPIMPSQAVIDACAVLCRKISEEHGVDLSLLSDWSMDNSTQTQKPDPNADIESFKAEMDEIFSTWEGGET